MMVNDLFFNNQPPCQNACPLRMDVRGYVNFIARGCYDDALRVIRKDNPLPAVCGRICHHPCELYCRRGYYDASIAIKDLKRFATEAGSIDDSKKEANYSEQVAVVGAGPAGLTAAWQLVNLGYQVKVFEKEEKPGGVLSFGIPEYRLPAEFLLKDIEEITKAGVEIEYNRVLGKNLSLEKLRNDFDAVVFALGLPLSRSLDIPGINLEGVLLALPFLRACRLKEPVDIGKKVAVLGGGNVALDTARTVLRLGAEKVYLVYRRTENEIPANVEECEHAKEEGIEFVFLTLPCGFSEKDGRVSGMECIKMKLGELDESGRCRPEPVEGTEFSFPVDQVIVAIGQAHDSELLSSIGLDLDDHGRLQVSPETMACGEKVYVCGELFLGPSTVSESMASGRKVAFSIHSSLNGEKLSLSEQFSYPKSSLVQVGPRVPRKERLTMPKEAPEVRKSSFAEIEKGYSSEMSRQEAKRCLTCVEEVSLDKEKCISCMTCVRVCPFEVPKVSNDYPVINSDRCCGCSVCFSECPVFALSFSKSWEDTLLERVVEKSKQGNGEILIACDFVSKGADEQEFNIPCLARLSSLFYLKAFEKGVKKITVTTCSKEECRMGEYERIIKGKIGRAVELLSQIGQEERLVINKESEGSHAHL